MLISRTEKPKINITSLPVVNTKLWGLSERELIVIAARTSNGKSSFALQLTMDVADQGFPVWFVSLEMPEESIYERMFCNKMEVDNQETLRGGFVKNKEIQKKFKIFNQITERWNLLLTIGIGMDYSEIVKTFEMFEEKPKLIVIDYIGNIKTRARQSFDDLTEYVRQMQEFAILNNICVIIVSQINRDAKNASPEEYQMKGTGALEEKPDKVILLHWNGKDKPDTDQEKGEYTIRVSKNRNGRTGKIPVRYIPKFYKFVDEEQFWKGKK
jgi:replicative DNA helicase